MVGMSVTKSNEETARFVTSLAINTDETPPIFNQLICFFLLIPLHFHSLSYHSLFLGSLATFLPFHNKYLFNPDSHSTPFSLSQTMKLTRSSFLVTLALLMATTFSSDPDSLQDLCVADLSSGVTVNGFTCKEASKVNVSDFSSNILAKPGSTNNTYGSVVTGANVHKVPGLNTLGVSLSRIDYAPGGLNPPHTHPRATEVVFGLEGELDVGFLTTADVLISKTISKGEIFVFPKGLVHFQKNNGNVPAAVLSAFNSQLPGKLFPFTQQHHNFRITPIEQHQNQSNTLLFCRLVLKRKNKQ